MCHSQTQQQSNCRTSPLRIRLRNPESPPPPEYNYWKLGNLRPEIRLRDYFYLFFVPCCSYWLCKFDNFLGDGNELHSAILQVFEISRFAQESECPYRGTPTLQDIGHGSHFIQALHLGLSSGRRHANTTTTPHSKSNF